MILQLTYATATDLISFTEKLVALQRARRSRVTQIQKEFNDIAYDIFVLKGVPFTEVVQFLQEFGSSVEMEKPARALFTRNMKTDTDEEKQKERLVRRNSMRRVVAFFNDMMLGYFSSRVQAVESARAEAENGPRLLTFSEAAAIFSLTEHDFRYIAEKARIPVISLGKDTSGVPVERISMRSLELFVQILSNASFADANTYIYQHSVLSYPTKDEFEKTKQFVLESVRANIETGKMQAEKRDNTQHKSKDVNTVSKDIKNKPQTGGGHSRNNNGMGGYYHAPQYESGKKKIFDKSNHEPEPLKKPWGNPASRKTPEHKQEAGRSASDKPEKSTAGEIQETAQSNKRSTETKQEEKALALKQDNASPADVTAEEGAESADISTDTPSEMSKPKPDEEPPKLIPTLKIDGSELETSVKSETSGHKQDDATRGGQEGEADADKNADFGNNVPADTSNIVDGSHVPDELKDMLAFARSSKAQ